MAFTFDVDSCVICRVRFESEVFKEPLVTLTETGLNTLRTFCDMCGQSDLSYYLSSNPRVVVVHVACRKKFTDKRRVCNLAANTGACKKTCTSKKLRSSAPSFNWKQHCFLCGEPAVFDKKHREKWAELRQVKSLEIRDNVLVTCGNRLDSWGLEVRCRLEMCSDLHAVDAVYHVRCHRNFSNLQFCRDSDVSGGGITGRPVDEQLMFAFDKTCDWLESNVDDMYTVRQIYEVMIEFAINKEKVYSMQYFQQKLQERYGDSLVISDVRGRRNVICFEHLAKRIINNKWYAERNEDCEDESRRIITLAAKLLAASVREVQYEKDAYPLSETLKDPQKVKEWMPDLMQLFLENVVKDVRKQVAIGHSLIQAIRPRSVITPVLFGVGVSVDHVLGSKWLLDLLSTFGFSVTYAEVDRYKKSVVGATVPECPASFPDAFSQWSMDNVDHNTGTLDGSNTFHGMGLISMTTSCLFVDTVPSDEAAETVPNAITNKNMDCLIADADTVPNVPSTFTDVDCLLAGADTVPNMTSTFTDMDCLIADADTVANMPITITGVNCLIADADMVCDRPTTFTGIDCLLAGADTVPDTPNVNTIVRGKDNVISDVSVTGQSHLGSVDSLHSVQSGNFGEKAVVRLCRDKASNVLSQKGIPIVYYCSPNKSPLTEMKFKPRIELCSPSTLSPCLNLDLMLVFHR